MEKIYRIKNLCCANCANKMQTKISKLSGVNECTINFMTSRLILDVEDGRLAEVIQEARKIIKKIEPAAEVM